MISAGTIFRFNNQGFGHYWFIISNPDQDPNQIVCVNMTSCRGDFDDQSCLLRPGDHPEITHESFIFYAKMTFRAKSNILTMLNQGLIDIIDPSCSEELLKRIRDGVIISPHAPNRYKQFLKAQNLA